MNSLLTKPQVKNLALKLVFQERDGISHSRGSQIQKLLDECFERIPKKEIRESFFAKGIGRVLALDQDSVIGQVEIFVRHVNFSGITVLVGGLGGVCVKMSARKQGIGITLLRRGLEILRQNKCDVACLNANTRDYPRGGIYYGLGFRLMKREISYTDASGRTRYDSGEMFIPILSREKYDLIMKSSVTFALGRGYW